MTAIYYGYHEWQRIGQAAKDDYTAQLSDRFGLDDLDVIAGIYLGEGGEVIGAVRYLLNEEGRKYAIGDQMAVELVGRDS